MHNDNSTFDTYQYKFKIELHIILDLQYKALTVTNSFEKLLLKRFFCILKDGSVYTAVAMFISFICLFSNLLQKDEYEPFHCKLWNGNTYIWWIAICQSMLWEIKNFWLNANCTSFHFNKYEIDKRILTKPIHLFHNHKSFKVCIKTPRIFYYSSIKLKSAAFVCNFLPIKIVYFSFYLECTKFVLYFPFRLKHYYQGHK